MSVDETLYQEQWAKFIGISLDSPRRGGSYFHTKEVSHGHPSEWNDEIGGRRGYSGDRGFGGAGVRDDSVQQGLAVRAGEL